MKSLLLLSLLLAGCAGNVVKPVEVTGHAGSDRYVIISDDWLPNEIPWVEAGIAFWAGTADLHKEGAMVLTIYQHGKSCTVDVDHDQGGWFNPNTNAICIAPYRLGADMMTPTFAAHEIGHSLGLTHIDDPNALMYYQPSAKEVKAADLAEFQEIYQ